MAEGKKKSDDDDLTGTLALAAVSVILVALVIVPALLSVATWFVVRGHLRAREYTLLLLIGMAGWVVAFSHNVTTYAGWLKAVAGGNFPIVGAPWLMLGLTTCLLVGAIGLLMGTAISAKIPARLIGTSSRKRPADESILPTDDQKRRVQVVKPVGGTLTVSANQHSIMNPQEPGKRQFPLGIDRHGKPVYVSEDEIRMHGLILGSTGSGKSKTIEALAGCLLDLGWSGMILDLKEDTAPQGLRDWCATYAQYHGMPFQELRLSDAHSPFWFNPLHGMGADEVRDTILTLQDFDDAYWQALNKELLGQVVNLVKWAHEADPTSFPEPTMYDIGKLMSTGSLDKATRKHRAVVLATIPGVTEEDFRVLKAPSQDQQKSSIGFGSKLTLIYDTVAGRAVLRPGLNSEKRLVDVTNPGLTYIGLDSQGKADLTKVISASVLQRMAVYAAQRTTGQITDPSKKTPRFLIVDEANWVDRTIVQNLLSRARSAGIAMFLCTQGPKDWIDKDGDDWGKLTQNVNVSIIMSQGEPESAQLCADYIGQKYKQQTSEMIRTERGMFGSREVRGPDGKVMESFSSREELAHIIDPDDLRRMGIGEAILRVGKPGERISWMKVMLRDPKAGPARVGR